MMFTTSRLYLRRFRPGDWRDLAAYLCDEAVVQYEPYNVFTPKRCRSEAINRMIDHAFIAVCLKQNDRLIGNIFLDEKSHCTFELGFIFAKAFWRHGYAFESSSEIMRYCFEELGAHRMMAQCCTENLASQKLLERLGMRKEAHHLHCASYKRDRLGNRIWWDLFEYAILFDEWEQKIRN